MRRPGCTEVRLLAFAAMLVDHVCMVLIEHAPEVAFAAKSGRVFGRLAFPLFAWGVLVGWHRTSDKPRYIARMAACAIVTQPIYAWHGSLSGTGGGANVCFLFLACMIAAYVGERFDRYVGIGVCAALSYVLVMVRVDYGLYGIAMMCSMYACGVGRKGLSLRDSLVAISPTVFLSFVLSSALGYPWYQAFAAVGFALAGVVDADGRGRSLSRVLTWCFYPAHLLLICVVCVMLGLR